MLLATSPREDVVHRLDPLDDARWGKFVAKHPRSSAFHTVAWLESLRRTYGYRPVVITTSPPDSELEDGLVFCRVDSWLTGRRLVSLPFSDHCEPLVEEDSSLQVILSAVEQEAKTAKMRYAEIRPLNALERRSEFLSPGDTYCFHHIDLTPDLDTLFGNCHKDSTQRKIRRAEREGLTYEEGRSEYLLDAFYRLLLLTRRRHLVPPQPRQWFQNLISGFGAALKIRVAFKESTPVAAILTLRHKETMVYKYGCSDAQFSNAGGTHLLFWKTIQEAKSEGVRVFDLGRSDRDNAGLVTFKDRWGSVRSELTYARLSIGEKPGAKPQEIRAGWKEKIAKGMFSHLPDRVLYSVGDLLYKHVG